jgi:dipeptidyl aminopeptidase/acylaminoacyl peptidase
VTRPDYEVPGGYLIDAIANQPFVDPDRIGVIGSSLGGYYAPRVAAADRRVKALVCSCVCFDVLKDLYSYYPPIRAQLRWIAGVANEAQAIKRYAEFTLAESAGKIRCPVLLTHGAADALMPASAAQRLFDEVASEEKVLRIWEPDEGGALHCNYDNWARCMPFMFDWLIQHLNRSEVA